MRHDSAYVVEGLVQGYCSLILDGSDFCSADASKRQMSNAFQDGSSAQSAQYVHIPLG
jgi:hypothetical protein